ncbi:MAG: hypothetical protein ACXVH7_14210 [Thermoanaerobaculia bacterium]
MNDDRHDPMDDVDTTLIDAKLAGIDAVIAHLLAARDENEKTHPRLAERIQERLLLEAEQRDELIRARRELIADLRRIQFAFPTFEAEVREGFGDDETM